MLPNIPVKKDGIVDLSVRLEWERIAQPLFYIDGVRYGTSFLSLESDNIESIVSVKGNVAVAQYGEDASAGVVLISLKENLPQG